MTGLLASVTGPEEASAVLQGGADIVDLKNPSEGALGAVPVEVLEATIREVAGRRPVSAVAGNLPMVPGAILPAVEQRATADFVKIGLFPASRGEQATVIEALEPLARRQKLIAVFFADAEPDFSLLDRLTAAGFHGAMIDTLGKDRSRPSGLLSHLALGRLGEFVERSRSLDLLTGLAGALEAPDIPRLLVLKPDYLGFRGALTHGGRADPVDANAVRQLKALIAQAASSFVDRSPRPRGADDDRPDLIFVRDFVLPMEIGAYGHERGRRQDVSFTVEAEIDRLTTSVRTMGDIYSYDVILDRIRALAASGHVDLVETLAVDLAEGLLEDERVRRVRVRVEKLELGPKGVGIEILRP